jgi:beta-lactamase class C
LIFEKVLKLPIDKIYEQFLFDPIGMCEANTSKEQLVNSKHASPHRINRQSRKAYPRSVSQKYYNAIPCGGINASISDMARFLQLVMGNFPDLLSSKELGFMLSPFVSTPGTRYFDRWSDESSSYGMGWRILKYRGRRLAYHGGFVNNYRTEIAFDLDRKIGICLLFNANSTYAKRAVPLFFDLWESTFIDKNI